MSVKTSVSSTAQSSQYNSPGMLLGPGALRALQVSITWRRQEGGVFCAVGECFVPQTKRRKHSAQLAGGMVLSQVCGGGLVVCNGLNPMPQAPSVSAVAETMGYPPGVLSLSLSDAAG